MLLVTYYIFKCVYFQDSSYVCSAGGGGSVTRTEVILTALDRGKMEERGKLKDDGLRVYKLEVTKEAAATVYRVRQYQQETSLKYSNAAVQIDIVVSSGKNTVFMVGVVQKVLVNLMCPFSGFVLLLR